MTTGLMAPSLGHPVADPISACRGQHIGPGIQIQPEMQVARRRGGCGAAASRRRNGARDVRPPGAAIAICTPIGAAPARAPRSAARPRIGQDRADRSACSRTDRRPCRSPSSPSTTVSSSARSVSTVQAFATDPAMRPPCRICSFSPLFSPRSSRPSPDARRPEYRLRPHPPACGGAGDRDACRPHPFRDLRRVLAGWTTLASGSSGWDGEALGRGAARETATLRAHVAWVNSVSRFQLMAEIVVRGARTTRSSSGTRRPAAKSGPSGNMRMGSCPSRSPRTARYWPRRATTTPSGSGRRAAAGRSGRSKATRLW